MKKLLLLVGVILICSSCTGVKKINGVDQTFTEYVLLNKNYNKSTEVDSGRLWGKTSSEMFPGLRLKKWIETD